MSKALGYPLTGLLLQPSGLAYNCTGSAVVKTTAAVTLLPSAPPTPSPQNAHQASPLRSCSRSCTSTSQRLSHFSLVPRPNKTPPGLARESGSGMVCCVMRYYSNGSLADLLTREQQRPQLSLTLKLRMALDIARGMAYLHARPNGQVSAGGTAFVL